jgi:hypothetical protein
MLGPFGLDQVRVDPLELKKQGSLVILSVLINVWYTSAVCSWKCTNRHCQYVPAAKSETWNWHAGATKSLICSLCEAGTYWTGSGRGIF